MSATAVTPTPADSAGGPPPVRPERALRRPPSALVLLYVSTAGVFFLLGLLRHGPTIVPDELTYGHLAATLANGQGFSWGGGHYEMRAALYVYLITPSWWLSSGYGAYTIAKLISAALISSAVFPTYLIARTVTDKRWALITCGLLALGTWMVAAGAVLTENLAFPLAAWTSYATVRALRLPGSRWVWIALGSALLATWSRYQLIILIPAVLLALALDVARADRNWRHRLTLHRGPLTIAAIAGTAWAVLFFADPRLVGGSYVGIGHFSPPFTAVASDVWEHAIALILMTGIVPAIVVLAAASRRSTWMDERIGPVLAATAALVVCLLVESSFFTAGFGSRWAIDRYVEYAAPLLLVFFIGVVTMRPAIPARRYVVASAAVALGLWFSPSIWNTTEQRALYGLSSRVHSLLGTANATSIGLVGSVVAALVIAIVASKARRAAILLIAATAVVMVVQSEKGWQWQSWQARQWMSQFPADKAWVDHHAGGPVARLIVSANSPLSATVGFFNHDITQVYVPAAPATYLGTVPLGHTCHWTVRSGVARLGSGCGRPATRFLLDDPIGRVHFYGERILARGGATGSLVAVPGVPRLRSVFLLPCAPRYVTSAPDGTLGSLASHTNCRGVLQGTFWIDHPTTLRVTFRGGTQDHSATMGGRTWLLPTGRDTTIRVPLPAGPLKISMGLDWTDSTGAPTVTAARLISPGRSDDLL